MNKRKHYWMLLYLVWSASHLMKQKADATEKFMFSVYVNCSGRGYVRVWLKTDKRQQTPAIWVFITGSELFYTKLHISKTQVIFSFSVQLHGKGTVADFHFWKQNLWIWPTKNTVRKFWHCVGNRTLALIHADWSN